MKNSAAIRRVLLITMGLNLAATAVELIVGYQTGAISVIANGFDSAFDSSSNVVGLTRISPVAEPASKEHPYGTREFETTTAIAIAILPLICWELGQTALARLHPLSSLHQWSVPGASWLRPSAPLAAC